MKLFIWEGDGILEDWSSGMIVALAPDEDAAVASVKAADETAHWMTFGAGVCDKPPASEVRDLPGCADTIKPQAWVVWGGS